MLLPLVEVAGDDRQLALGHFAQRLRIAGASRIHGLAKSAIPVVRLLGKELVDENPIQAAGNLAAEQRSHGDLTGADTTEEISLFFAHLQGALPGRFSLVGARNVGGHLAFTSGGDELSADRCSNVSQIPQLLFEEAGDVRCAVLGDDDLAGFLGSSETQVGLVPGQCPGNRVAAGSRPRVAEIVQAERVDAAL